MYGISKKAYEAKFLFESLDIRSVEELVLHICECGQDIGKLKREIKWQEKQLLSLQPQVDAIHRWETEKDEASFAFLLQENCASPNQMADIKKAYNRASVKKDGYLLLLEERSREYRKLKTAESILNPLSCEEAWNQYMAVMFSENKILDSHKISAVDLEHRICELGELLGIQEEVMDRYLDQAESIATWLQWDENYRNEYCNYKKKIFSADQKERKGFQHYREEAYFIQELWDLRNKLSGFGLLGFLLSVLIETWAEMEHNFSQFKLDVALWTALLEKLYAESQHRKNVASELYYPEILAMSRKRTQEASDHLQKIIQEEFASEKTQTFGILPQPARQQGAKKKLLSHNPEYEH